MPTEAILQESNANRSQMLMGTKCSLKPYITGVCEMLAGTRCLQETNVALLARQQIPSVEKRALPPRLVYYLYRLALPVSQTTGFLICTVHLPILLLRIMLVTAHHHSNSMCWGSEGTVKRPLSKRPQIGFQDQLSLNAVIA